MSIINNIIDAIGQLMGSPIVDKLLQIIMLAGVFLCACHSAAKHAVINTRDEYDRLGRMAKQGKKPRWSGTQWRRYYYIKTVVLVCSLLLIELWAAVMSKYLALGIVAVAILLYLDHTMITWLEATSRATYDNHRRGKVIKLAPLHISVYPKALLWTLPVTAIGMAVIFTVDVLLIFLFAVTIFGWK